MAMLSSTETRFLSLLAPFAIYLAMAMSSPIDIGIRHIARYLFILFSVAHFSTGCCQQHRALKAMLLWSFYCWAGPALRPRALSQITCLI